MKSLCYCNFAFFVIFIHIISLVQCHSENYNVQWIEGPITISHQKTSHMKSLDIYCFKKMPRKVLNVWTSVYIHLDIDSNYFEQYKGSTPDEVWDNYSEDLSIWPSLLFPSYKARSLTVDPFESTCVALKTDQKYTIRIQINNVDSWKLALLIVGLLLFLFSRSISENSLFFYISGICFGVCTSIMILVYFISKMLPGKPIVYTSMIGGWAVGLYALKILWSNFQPLIYSYKIYIAWYILATSLISFVVCYRKGPPQDQRSKNLIKWGLQGLGLVCVYFSTQLIQAYIIPVIVLIIIKYGPYSWLVSFMSLWRRKYPPKRVFLTREEYYQQGVKETAKALDDLRKYCHSPDCEKWDLINKLDDPRRFSRFVSGEGHTTQTEVADHNSDLSFVIRRRNLEEKSQLKEKYTPPVHINDDYLTSDDSSFSDD